jgi:flavodoxin
MTRKDGRTGFDLTRRTFMKYALSGLVAGAVTPGLFRVSAAKAAEPVRQERKILVVFYSRTGNTRALAEVIHATVGGDIIEIKTVNPYPAEYRATTQQAKKELESGYKPPLDTKIAGMASYDVVFVGSPCWWGTIATPVISFLSEYDMSGKTLVPFMTHKGSGLGRTMAHVRSLCPKATVKEGLAIRDGEVRSSRRAIAIWLRGLGMA